MNNKSVIAVVSLVVISFLGYWLLKTRPDQLSSPSPILSPTSTQSAFSVPGWKTCRYPDFGFDLQYPPGWIISATSNSQGGGEEPQFLVTCGDGNTKPTDIVGPLSFHPGPESTSTGDIGMQIQPQNN